MNDPHYIVRTFKAGDFNINPPGLPAPNPNVTAQRTQRVASVTVKHEDSRSWRITLGRPNLEIRTAAGTFLAPADMVWNRAGGAQMVAIVRWGDTSGVHEAIVDWVQGCTFTVHGFLVTVDAQIPEDAVTSFPDAAGQTRRLRVAAHIAPDQGGGEVKPPTWSSRMLDLAANGGLGQVIIPAFARRVRWHEVISDAAPIGAVRPPIVLRFSQWTDDGSSIPVADVHFSSHPSTLVPLAGGYLVGGWPTDEGGWSIAAMAKYVTVENNDPVVGVSVILEFDLDIA